MEKMSKLDKIFIRELFRKIGKAIYDYHLVNDGDRILVGVSGGKDSLTLLQTLALRAQNSREHYTVAAAHIAVQNVAYAVNADYLRAFCRNLGVELVERTIDPTVRADSGKPTCFVCSWMRRKMMFEITKELNCNKLALGHHRDDAVESLLMSMVYNGAVSSMPPSLSMFEGRLALIRPLIYLSNQETSRYAEINAFRKQEKNCPYEKATNRHNISQIINQLEELTPDARNNLFAAMKNIRTEYLP